MRKFSINLRRKLTVIIGFLLCSNSVSSSKKYYFWSFYTVCRCWCCWWWKNRRLGALNYSAYCIFHCTLKGTPLWHWIILLKSDFMTITKMNLILIYFILQFSSKKHQYEMALFFVYVRPVVCNNSPSDVTSYTRRLNSQSRWLSLKLTRAFFKRVKF